MNARHASHRHNYSKYSPDEITYRSKDVFRLMNSYSKHDYFDGQSLIIPQPENCAWRKCRRKRTKLLLISVWCDCHLAVIDAHWLNDETTKQKKKWVHSSRRDRVPAGQSLRWRNATFNSTGLLTQKSSRKMIAVIVADMSSSSSSLFLFIATMNGQMIFLDLNDALSLSSVHLLVCVLSLASTDSQTSDLNHFYSAFQFRFSF